ncbi:peptide chain release factor N(5)-glutamine methyltransferase [Xylophilus sp. ASV27]|uniref:peptide chain release factor N(5)-glutamine methyltransferase n=1 Tax=Xylophilus sp. ASV27 TaxID=2795129 RepID=UPI0018EBE90A|nr:peptide chain release factor N(5)-glutamine methyltransferase [Xylophilus sp. ASV27]
MHSNQAPPISIAQALQAAGALGLERLDAQLLLLHALGRPAHERAWLLAHDTDLLDAATQQRLCGLCSRRAAGEPLAYLVGEKEFFGLPLAVDARVLVPRPDTETLVEWALERLAGQTAPSVLDLGTGSGAIALALRHARPDAQVSAVDASAGALEVARGNAARLGLPLRLLQGDWYAALPAGERYGLIVSNPPYIAADDRHLAALAHEPPSALVAGADGLDELRRIIAQAPGHLALGGWLLLEHGWDQAGAVRTLLQAAGFDAVQSRRDLAGIERCSGGLLPSRR